MSIDDVIEALKLSAIFIGYLGFVSLLASAMAINHQEGDDE